MNTETKASTVQIRDADLSDIASIVRIDAEISGINKPDYWQESYKLFSGEKEQGAFLVAEWEAQIVGFIAGEVRAWEFGSTPCGWVFALGVQNHERLHGVGTAMLNAICQRFKQRGINKVRTMVDRRNREVLAFFRSQGMMAGPYLELEKDLF